MSTTDLRNALMKLESDIHDVERYGNLLMHIEASPHELRAGDLHVLSLPLAKTGARLRETWKAAWIAAGGAA